MIKLSDTQRILLSTASQREDGSVLPLPAGIKPGGGATKALAALVKCGFVHDRQTSDAAATDRTEGNVQTGFYISHAGLVAIGVESLAGVNMADTAAHVIDVAAAPLPTGKAASKTATVLALLGRVQGATVADLISATGWLPHTTRAALTGLRKKGHDITRGKVDGVTCYRIAEAG